MSNDNYIYEDRKRVKLVNKAIDGGQAGPVSWITLPAGTTAELAALERREGSIAYDETLNTIVVDDGSGFAPVAVEPTAENVSYDNSASGLDADNVQEAIDEIAVGAPNDIPYYNGDGELQNDSSTHLKYDGSFHSLRSGFAQGGSAVYNMTGEGSLGIGHSSNGTFNATGQGAIVSGLNSGTITASGSGAFATGSVNSGSSVIASGIASFAGASFGGGGGVITASGSGSVAKGRANVADITASGTGAEASGNAQEGDIIASGDGSKAFGYTVGGNIEATGHGSIAHGSLTSGSLTAEGEGAHASGTAVSGGTIEAIGDASFAHGFEAMSVSGVGAAGFGTGHSVTSDYAFVVGQDAVVVGTAETPAATDTLFAVGNSNATNALEVKRDGQIILQGAIVTHGIRIVDDNVSLDPMTDYKVVLNDTDMDANTIGLPPGVDGLTFLFSPITAANQASWALDPDGSDTIDGDVPANLASTAGPKQITFFDGVWYYI